MQQKSAPRIGVRESWTTSVTSTPEGSPTTCSTRTTRASSSSRTRYSPDLRGVVVDVVVVDVVVDVLGGGFGLPPLTSFAWFSTGFRLLGAGTVGGNVMPGGGMWKRRSPYDATRLNTGAEAPLAKMVAVGSSSTTIADNWGFSAGTNPANVVT
jgi:hypothetical protein